MAEFVGAAAVEIGKCSVEPVKRQFNYLCCFNSNIQNLMDEAKKLDDTKIGVEGQVDAARRNTEVIVPQVETWLDDVNKIQANVRGIEIEIRQVKSHCLAIKSRFSLSRRATKMVVAMKELQDDRGKFGQMSNPPPPAAMASIPITQTYELESRKHFEEDIMATLREKKMSMMGIYGMGGVGKTTMAKNIMSRARGESLFDEIVMAVVSQPIDMFRIQNEMAELLGLKLEVESLQARAHLLRTRLMNTKSILVILDDLWIGLNLEDLGIPHQRDSTKCTIILTSRNRNVFSSMNVEQTFQMKTLEDLEAWSLFKEKVGACTDDQSLFTTALEIVRECNGLPIALVTIGEALKDKTSKFIWEDAVQELRSCNPRDIPDFIAQVYNPLKLSYDLLESEHARSIFRMCSLFPEDREIRISNLGLCAWGLGIFEGITSLEVARNKVLMLVEMLKSRSLLLEGRDDGFTKMHDVVRDVGIFIAKNKGLIDPNLSWKNRQGEESNYNIDCTWICLFDEDKITLPRGLIFPKLRFLLIEGPHSWPRKELPLCDNFFESARKLQVLSIEKCRLSSLPHSIQLLKNLRTLILCFCSSLEDISVVGELVSLEILYCHECYWIKELPVEIGKLNQLKLLDISYCRNLRTIAAGVISGLTRLEELTLIKSFTKWELRVEEGKNAALCELNSLSSLTTLRIQIENASLAAEQIHLSSNLVEFDIQIGNLPDITLMVFHQSRSYGREMKLELEGDIIIGDWIHQLVRSTEKLLLCGASSSKLVPLLPEFLSLKLLIFQHAKMTRLIDTTSSGTTTAIFPMLECLSLQDIDELEEIHNGSIPSDSFKNLQVIDLARLPKLQHLWNVVPLLCNLSSICIVNCCRLRSVFPWAMRNNYLLQLKSLAIRSSSMLEQVVLWNEEENEQSSRNHRRVTFPKLEELTLYDLPRLTSFCKGVERIEFPLLTRMDIVKCPNLKCLLSVMENDKKCSGDINHDAGDSLHFFCKPEAAFGRLKAVKIKSVSREICRLWCDEIAIGFFTGLVILIVSNCDKVKSLFSTSIAGNLVNLKRLSIQNCHEMVRVIEDEEAERSPFMKLEVLKLVKLPKLQAFCDWRCAIEFSSLGDVLISKCPQMERFSFGSSIAPNLKRITINNEDISNAKDLNDALFWGDLLHLEILFGTD